MVYNRLTHLHRFWHGKSRHLLCSRNLQLQQQLLQLCCFESRIQGIQFIEAANELAAGPLLPASLY